jgi:hypothetical protein
VAADGRTTVRGHIHRTQDCTPGDVVVGVFADRIAQSVPVRHTTLPGAGEFVIDDVPAGEWHLLANTVEPGAEDGDGEAYVAAAGPITVRPDATVRPVDMRLRTRQIFDPPALLAHLDQHMLQALETRTPDSAGEAVTPMVRSGTTG